MINPEKLHQYENEAVGGKDSIENCRIGELCSEVRRLMHELSDPNYLYAGRIHRQAILSRDGKIDRLRSENNELKARLAKLEGDAT